MLIGFRGIVWFCGQYYSGLGKERIGKGTDGERSGWGNKRIGKGMHWEANGLGEERIVSGADVVGVSCGVRAGWVQRMFMIDKSLP